MSGVGVGVVVKGYSFGYVYGWDCDSQCYRHRCVGRDHNRLGSKLGGRLKPSPWACLPHGVGGNRNTSNPAINEGVKGDVGGAMRC